MTPSFGDASRKGRSASHVINPRYGGHFFSDSRTYIMMLAFADLDPAFDCLVFSLDV